jgi:hypothetical protein
VSRRHHHGPAGLAFAILVALALLAPGAGAAGGRDEPVDESVRTVLHDGRYRFCHEDDYPLTSQEHAWCPLVGKTSGACPSLPKACTLPPVEIVGSLFGGRRVRGAKSEIAPPPDDDTRRRPPERIALPDMSGFAQVLFFALLAAGIFVVVRALLKNLKRERDDAEVKDDAPPAADPAAGPPAVRGPIETDVERLLARARAAAARGEYARAVDDAYAALLRRLDGDGLIEIHPSRTNGDYVRNLRDRPDLKGAVRGIVRDVEGVQFGATPPSEPVFRSVLERVIPLVSRALSILIVFLGLSSALSCVPHGSEGDDERAGTSPTGTQAIVEVMTRQGVKIRHRNESLAKLERPMAVVLRSSVRLDADGWKHLLEWVREKGGSLILAGVDGIPDEIGEHDLYDTESSPEVTGQPDLWVGSPTLSLPPGRRLAPRTGATGVSDAGEDVLLVRRDSIVATEHRLGKGRVIVFADDRLFTNEALAVAEDAAFLLTTLFHASVSREREVELCDQWTGAGAQTPVESMRNAHMTPVVIQLFVLLALLFLWKGLAFARLRDPPAGTRRSFADHARALGTAYGRARASHHVAGLYSVWALDRLRERMQRSGRPGLIALAEGIATRTGRPVGEVMQVLVEASGARDEAPPSSFRPSSRRGPTPPPRGKDSAEADFELMRALASFLTATGQRPSQRTPPER